MAQHEISGPFMFNKDTIEKNMWNVALALIPAALVSVFFFGYYAVYLILSPALTAVLIDMIFTGQSFPGDGSAFVTGMLLGFSIPANSPWWLPLLGSGLAIIVGKQLFGGLGNNVFNPALVGRAIIRISFAGLFAEWPAPFTGITAATPLAERVEPVSLSFFNIEGSYELWELFIGNIPGAVGETSAAALLLGAVFLYFKGYIGWRITGGYILSAAVFGMFLGLNPLFTIFSGALILGSCFMATDMVTSPSTKDGRLIFGIGCGILTIVMREFTEFSGGVTFAILAMNGASYLLDNLFEGPRMGQLKQRETLYNRLLSILFFVFIFILLTWTAIKLQSLF